MVKVWKDQVPDLSGLLGQEFIVPDQYWQRAHIDRFNITLDVPADVVIKAPHDGYAFCAITDTIQDSAGQQVRYPVCEVRYDATTDAPSTDATHHVQFHNVDPLIPVNRERPRATKVSAGEAIAKARGSRIFAAGSEPSSSLRLQFHYPRIGRYEEITGLDTQSAKARGLQIVSAMLNGTKRVQVERPAWGALQTPGQLVALDVSGMLAAEFMLPDGAWRQFQVRPVKAYAMAALAKGTKLMAPFKGVVSQAYTGARQGGRYPVCLLNTGSPLPGQRRPPYRIVVWNSRCAVRDGQTVEAGQVFAEVGEPNMIEDPDEEVVVGRYSVAISVADADGKLGEAVLEGRGFDHANAKAYVLQMVEVLKQKAAE